MQKVESCIAENLWGGGGGEQDVPILDQVAKQTPVRAIFTDLLDQFRKMFIHFSFPI